MLGGDAQGAIRRDSERTIVAAKLARAFRAKYGPEQGERLVQTCSLRPALEYLSGVGWVVEGDVARGVREIGRYEVFPRMVRRDGVWRIQLPPQPPPADAKINKNDEDLLKRRRDVLEHLDKYPTVGSIVEMLESVRWDERDPTTKEYVAEMEKQVRTAERILATRPTTSPEEAFMANFAIMLRRLSAARFAENPVESAKFYVADGDDGSYTLAREKRSIAIHHLLEAADKEIGGDAGKIEYEFQLTDVADDLTGLAMIEWKVDGDRAVGVKPEGLGERQFWMPTLKRVDGQWKIDVTEEMNGKPKQAKARADEEAARLEQITRRVERDEFKTADQLREVLKKLGIKGSGKPM
jgi:hypothetical protein